MFERSPKKGRKTYSFSNWYIGCYNRLSWPCTAFRHSGTCGCAVVEGLFFVSTIQFLLNVFPSIFSCHVEYFYFQGYRDAHCLFVEMLINKDKPSSSSTPYVITRSDYCLCLAIHAPRKEIIEVPSFLAIALCGYFLCWLIHVPKFSNYLYCTYRWIWKDIIPCVWLWGF